jgi:hypothetical protein
VITTTSVEDSDNYITTTSVVDSDSYVITTSAEDSVYWNYHFSSRFSYLNRRFRQFYGNCHFSIRFRQLYGNYHFRKASIFVSSWHLLTDFLVLWRISLDGSDVQGTSLLIEWRFTKYDINLQNFNELPDMIPDHMLGTQTSKNLCVVM